MDKPGKHALAKKAHGKRSRVDEERAARKELSLSKREEAEVVQLNKRIAEHLPPPGSVENEFTEFSQLPLCKYTQTGLQRGKFSAMTQIQRAAIPHALGGRDILGAAKTGSGKTLSFLIPVLDCLFRARWSAGDGAGAIVISPTRELAMQIFEVLKVIGQAHFSLSAGLITGGKDFEEEREGIGRMAVLVATPGRLLQHLEQSPDFDVSGLRVLVLDEADRLLDLGFADTVNSIIKYLPAPPQRQTLLFSATQTKSVRDLARLSLRAPEYIAVHDKAETATPSRLTQHYVLAKAQDKLNLLFSFLRTHTHNKSIIFVSSCKEARFMFEAFRRLRPGVPLQVLHGKMKQTRRMLVYYDFLKKSSAALFATDVAARGLDFTGVDWVLQLDCPEDAATYIHRAGRTARFTAKGHALCVLTPSEAKGMLPALATAKVPIAEIRINPNSAISITGKLAAEVAADPSLKQLAQRAFCSYLRSVALQRNKDIFKATDVDLDALSDSFGLATTPDVKIVRYLAEGGEGREDVTLEQASKLSAEQGDALRKDAHKKKNSNKSLSRLKEKILAEKTARRAAAAHADSEEGESGSDGDGSGRLGTDDSSGEDEEDGESEEERHKTVAPPAKKKAPPPAPAGGGRSARVEEEEDEADAVLVRKKVPSAAVEAAIEAGSLYISHEDMAKMTDRERMRALKIVRETRALGVEAETGGVGADGLTPFQRVALMKKAEAGAGGTATGAGGVKHVADRKGLTIAVAAQAALLAARLASRSDVDRETERVRVREKHRREKAAAKGRTEEEEEEEGGGGGGVTLGGADSVGEGDESMGEGGPGADDGSSSSEDSSSSSSESDEDMPPARARAMVAVVASEGSARGGAKRQRSGQDGKGGGGGSKEAAPLPSTVQDMEALALSMMERKPKKART